MRGLPLPRPCHPRRAPACLASSGVPLAAPQARTPRAARPLPPSSHSVTASFHLRPARSCQMGRCFAWHMFRALCDVGGGAEL